MTTEAEHVEFQGAVLNEIEAPPKQSHPRRHCALQGHCEHAENGKDGRRKGRRAQGKKLVTCRQCTRDFCSRACLRKHHTLLPFFDCPGAGDGMDVGPSSDEGGHPPSSAPAASHTFGFGHPYRRAPSAGGGGGGRHMAAAIAAAAAASAAAASAAAAIPAAPSDGTEWLQQSLQVLWECHYKLAQLVPEPLRAGGLLQGLGFVAQALIMQGPQLLQPPPVDAVLQPPLPPLYSHQHVGLPSDHLAPAEAGADGGGAGAAQPGAVGVGDGSLTPLAMLLAAAALPVPLDTQGQGAGAGTSPHSAAMGAAAQGGGVVGGGGVSEEGGGSLSHPVSALLGVQLPPAGLLLPQQQHLDLHQHPLALSAAALGVGDPVGGGWGAMDAAAGARVGPPD